MKRLVVFLMIVLLFACSKESDSADKWMNLFSEGKYEELLNQTIYSDEENAVAFKNLALIGLKEFSKLDIEGEDPFFETLRKFIETRQKIFEGMDVGFSVVNGRSKFPRAFQALKEYIEKLNEMTFEEKLRALSKAYDEMKRIEKSLEKDLDQSQLVDLKRRLNKLFDSELLSTPESDVRKRLFRKLIDEIDSRLRIISPGVDRPQS